MIKTAAAHTSLPSTKDLKTETESQYIFPTVQKAEEAVVAQGMIKESQSGAGHAGFLTEAQKFLFGEQSITIKDKKIASNQASSVNAALKAAVNYMTKNMKDREVLFPEMSSSEHSALFKSEKSLKSHTYNFFDKKTKGVNFEAFLKDLKEAKENAVIFMYGNGDHPAGVSLTKQQWDRTLQVFKGKKFMAFFHCTQQGLNSHFEEDAYAVRTFAKANIPMFVTQSFAQNMGSPVENVAALHFVAENNKSAKNTQTDFSTLLRQFGGVASLQGATIAHRVLSSPEMKKAWIEELKQTAEKIALLRKRSAQRVPLGAPSHV